MEAHRRPTLQATLRWLLGVALGFGALAALVPAGQRVLLGLPLAPLSWQSASQPAFDLPAVLGKPPRQVRAAWEPSTADWIPVSTARKGGPPAYELSCWRGGIQVDFPYTNEQTPLQWAFVSSGANFSPLQLLALVGVSPRDRFQFRTVPLQESSGFAGIWVGLPGAPPPPEE